MKHRYIKNYTTFLKEAFDLNSYITKEKISPQTFEIATDIINDWYKECDDDNIPFDIKNKKDNLVLWYARNLKKYAIKFIDDKQSGVHDYIEKNGFDVSSLRKDTIDGKDTKNYINAVYRKLSKPMINHIKDYIFSLNRNTQTYKINFMSTFDEMYNKSIEWHESLKASGLVKTEEGYIIKKYDDGYYWVDLLTNNCKEEADAMGHCGKTSANTLLSLRKKNIKGIEPYVTIAVDYYYDETNVEVYIENGRIPRYSTLYQCKGKNNKKPVSKYHRYIVDLLLDSDIDISEIEEEYSPEEDFQLYDLTDVNILTQFLDKKSTLFFKDNYVDFILFMNNKPFLNKIFEYIKKGRLTFEHNFTNLFTLVSNELIPFSIFTKYFPLVDKYENGIIYMRTNAYDLTNFSVLYSSQNENDDTVANLELNSDHVELPSVHISDILNKYGYNISKENLEKIYQFIEPHFNTYEFQMYYSFEEFIDDYKNIICEIEFEKLHEMIIDSYEEVRKSKYFNEKIETISKPLFDFIGRDDFEYMPLKPELMIYLGVYKNDIERISKNDTSIDLYSDLFHTLKMNDVIDLEFKFNLDAIYNYDNWTEDFNEKLEIKIKKAV